MGPKSRGGTLPYRAPEGMTGNTYDELSEVYSFAIICWEVITGLKPWEDVADNEARLISLVTEGTRPRFATEAQSNTPLGKLIQRCWSSESESRPPFKEIKRELSQHLHAPMDHEPQIVRVTISGKPSLQPVLRWIPDRTNEMHKAWGLLLQTGTGNVNTGDMSREDMIKMIDAFRHDRPLYVLSTRFAEPSKTFARKVKQMIESGQGKTLDPNIATMSPCYNPNEDNVNYVDSDEIKGDQEVSNNRWLFVWEIMAQCAKTSGGRMLQLRDDTRGMSNMQHAEERLAQTNKLDIVVLKVPPSGLLKRRGTSGRIAID